MIFNLFNKKKKNSDIENNSFRGDIPLDLVEEFEKNVFQMASEHPKRFVLDYSEKSLEHVEEMLGELHEGYLETKNDEGTWGLAMMYGFYIGKTININKGVGHFGIEEHKVVGPLPFYVGEEVLAITNWTLKRILDGPADNIVSKYLVFMKRFDEKKNNK